MVDKEPEAPTIRYNGYSGYDGCEVYFGALGNCCSRGSVATIASTNTVAVVMLVSRPKAFISLEATFSSFFVKSCVHLVV